jgi:hypothetical protein
MSERLRSIKPFVMDEGAIEVLTAAINSVVVQHLPKQYHHIAGPLVRATSDAIERLPVSSAVQNMMRDLERRPK